MDDISDVSSDDISDRKNQECYRPLSNPFSTGVVPVAQEFEVGVITYVSWHSCDVSGVRCMQYARQPGLHNLPAES